MQSDATYLTHRFKDLLQSCKDPQHNHLLIHRLISDLYTQEEMIVLKDQEDIK